MLKARPAVLAGGLALAIGLPAHAQSLGVPEGDRIKIALSAVGSYETDVAHEGTSAAAAQGLVLGDYIFSPTATLDIQQSFGRGRVFLSGSTAYNFYDRNTVLNRENIDLKGGVQHPISLCNTTASGDYSRGLDQLANVTSQEIKDTYTHASVSLEAQCGRAVGFAPIFSVQESWTTNSDTQLQVSDARTTSASAGLSYQTPVNGTLSASGTYSDTVYPNSDISGPFRNYGYEMVGANLKYVRRLGARIQGTLGISYSVVNSSGATGFRGLTYDAELSYRASSRLSFDGVFTRQIIPSNLIGASYQLENDYNAKATYQLGPRLSFGLGASEQVGNEVGSVALNSPLLLHYDLRSIFTSLTYQMRRAAVTLDVRNDLRTANQAELDYSDTRVSLTLSALF